MPIGMDRRTGRPIGGLDHLRQSIKDILTTRIGTRVERREYGSRLPELVDQPINRRLQVEAFAATAQALRRWEPRLRINRVRMTEAGAGWLEIALDAVYLPSGQEVQIDGVVIA